MKIAVITGASSGMGREFVKQLTDKFDFDEVWVVARRLERLEALKDEVKVNIRPISLDLIKTQSIEEFGRMLEKEQPEIAALVNASGFGLFKAFDEAPLDSYYEMIALNDSAVVGMTYKALPYMKPGSRIWNICSVAAFQPVPYINVYGATKAFALSFTRALNAELKPRGIKALAVCPYWTKTEFFDRAVTDSTISRYECMYDPRKVVERAVSDMDKRKDVSIYGKEARMNAFLTKLLPHRFVMNFFLKQQKLPKRK
ncbi:MAG: SDR family NAD(P)-dependent oxidoreductase [Clostridia bacterium]|nr:SDR family NAD(P)-dependent oxidoreductase [Clostridia bacterium]